jgi:hypothetical protein
MPVPQIDHLDPEVREQVKRLVITGATIIVKRDEAPEDLSVRDIVEYLLLNDGAGSPLLEGTAMELMTVGLGYSIDRYMQVLAGEA